ncbi:hypothetical protein LPJ74_002780 [Coemansia sp. RSA 1843]|nr:hypothetical protein LPJ74_002780 [Coemansia sp. RSA 1843]
MLSVLAIIQCSSWTEAHFPLSVAVLPLLILQPTGYYPFQLVNLIGIYRSLSGHTDLDELPWRMNLSSIAKEFKYNVNESFFVIRAIFRATWRPMIPIYILDSLLNIATVGEIFHNIKSIKMFGWERMYVDRRLQKHWSEAADKSVVPCSDSTSIISSAEMFQLNVLMNKFIDMVMSFNSRLDDGELVAVVGKTGSGKSSLLLSICGEVKKTRGSGAVYGSTVFMEQSPWIINDTIRENILFGHDYEEDHYNKVVEACALADDLKTWANGDRTVIGERGINISGGQRARLALARTVYSKADIYILDDPLSAVDAHVKRHILEHVIMDSGLLGGKLRIISINAESLLPYFDQVIRLNDGKLSAIQQVPQKYRYIANNHPTTTNGNSPGGSGTTSTDLTSAYDSGCKSISKGITSFLMTELSEALGIILQYMEIDREDILANDAVKPSSDWPSEGTIEFRNFSMKYHNDLEYALKNINLTIKPGEKIGIVGRTGAGKTSLSRAIFRLISSNTCEGSILIDGCDISSIKLGDLRPKLGTIPQESTLFKGSFKQNLDPLMQFTIEDMWAALIKCSITEFVVSKDMWSISSDGDYNEDNDYVMEEMAEWDHMWQESDWQKCIFLWLFIERPQLKDVRDRRAKHGLDKDVGNQSQLSSGQKQLFSLCRLLMRKCKIIVLDEATADVDTETDRDMQKLFRSEFKDSTVLTIAHRLETIMSSDRIIVMNEGRVAEIGPPKELIKQNSYFAELVKANNF